VGVGDWVRLYEMIGVRWRFVVGKGESGVDDSE
jgi:hypothetical protein